MRRLACSVLAALMLAAPGALADAFPADAVREVGFSSFVSASSSELALYAGDTANATTLELRAARLRVTVWTATYVEATQGPMPTLLEVMPTRADYDLHDATVTLAEGDHAGWLGVRDLATGTLRGSAGATVASALGSRLGQGVGGAQSEDPAQPHFLEAREGAHLVPSGFDALDGQGSFELRFAGLDVRLDADENDTRLESGWRYASGSDPFTRAVWVSLRPDKDATMTLRGLADVTAQARSTSLSWTGTARIVDAAGITSFVPEGAAAAEADPAGLLLRPREPADAGVAALAPVASAVGNPAVAALLVLAFAGAVAGGIAWGRARADPLRDWDPEDLVALAYDASQAGDHDEARRWIKRARARAPESRRLGLDEAFIEDQAGQTARAREILTALARSGDADGAWMLARLLLHEGAHPSDVEALVVQALDSRPILALELRDDGALSALETRPAVERAMKAAVAKLDARR